MKRTILCVAMIILVVASCTKDTLNDHYTFYRPIYATKAEVRANIKSGPPKPLVTPGKFVVLGNFVFLNDLDHGIHIISIADPSNPKTVAFIDIPGCVDIAVNGNILYADCYTDMVTMDITDPLNLVVKQFLYNVFPARSYGTFFADTGKVIRDWIRVDTTVSTRFSGSFEKNYGNVVFFASQGLFPGYAASSSSVAGLGIAGSLSCFAQMNNRLYTISTSDLKVFNTSVASAPFYVKTLNLQNGSIETIFPYNDKLFIGSQIGMMIYDAHDPDQPQKLGQVAHIRTCDPVIADGNYAYVTLRGNGKCGGPNNELDIVDMSNVLSPQIISTYQLSSPMGLAKDGNILFVCDGTQGLKILDATNVASVLMLKQIPGFEPSDVIMVNGIAVVVAKDGLYTISYSDRKNIQVVGKIPITSK